MINDPTTCNYNVHQWHRRLATWQVWQLYSTPACTGINDSFVYCIHAGAIVLFRKVGNRPGSLCVPTSLACVLHTFTFGRNFVLRVYVEHFLPLNSLNCLWTHSIVPALTLTKPNLDSLPKKSSAFVICNRLYLSSMCRWSSVLFLEELYPIYYLHVHAVYSSSLHVNFPTS